MSWNEITGAADTKTSFADALSSLDVDSLSAVQATAAAMQDPSPVNLMTAVAAAQIVHGDVGRVKQAPAPSHFLSAHQKQSHFLGSWGEILGDQPKEKLVTNKEILIATVSIVVGMVIGKHLKKSRR